MKNKPDIVLTGRFRRGYDSKIDEARDLFLYEHDLTSDEPVFRYEFTDWDNESYAYFKYGKCGKVFFRRQDEGFEKNTYVTNNHRSYAYSEQEIRNAIENYLVEKLLLTEAP